MTFNDFIKKYNLRNKATSNIKIYEVLKNIGLDTKVEIYLRDGSFSTHIGIVNLHPSKGTHWVCYKNENYFDSYECVPPKKLSIFITKRNGYCFYSKYQIQKNDSFCGSYCLYIIYLTKLLGYDFKPTVLNLYYQRFSEKYHLYIQLHEYLYSAILTIV